MRAPPPPPARLALAAALAALAALAPASPARAGDDPSRSWRTLRTPHFRVHHEPRLEALAREAAARAEEAHRRIRDWLGWVPTQPVEVVLEDRLDASNGFARAWPYDHVTLWAAPPGPESELAVFDDPLRTLVLHEYVHVAHMDTVSGVPAFVNRLLGKTMLPNGASPSWWIEGLATFAETALTGGGRVGSTPFERVLRMAALEGRFLDLSGMATAPLELPRGGAFYVYGGAFVEFLYRRSGAAGLSGFVRQYGHRLAPFAMNTVARRVFGEDLVTLYRAFRDEVEARARATAARVREAGEVAGRPLTAGAEDAASPLFRPDGGGLWYVRADGRREPAVMELDLATGREVRRWDCRGGCGRLARGGGSLWTTHAVPSRLYASHGEVFRLEAGGRARQATRGARARDLAATPDGTLWWVATEAGRVSLEERGPDGARRTPVPPGAFTDLGDPRPLPGGGLAFAGHRDGRWDLWHLAPGEGAPRRLTDDGCRDRDPVATPDGRWLIFVSDPGGIDDLFALDPASGERRRITRVLGGVRDPAVSPDGTRLAFSTYSSTGWDLALLPLDPAAWPPADPSEACRPAPTPPAALPANGPVTAYDAAPSLRPRALRPSLSGSTLGDLRLGASLDGSDALGHHAFVLGFDADVQRGRPSAWASYGYGGWWASLGVDLATWHGFEAAVVDDRLVAVPRRAWLLNLQASIPVRLRTRSLAFGAGWSLRWVSGTRVPAPTDPAASPPILPSGKAVGGLTAWAVHDSTRAVARSVGPEQGVHAGLSVGLRHPVPWDRGWGLTVAGHAFGYVPLPWRGNHVLALLGSGDASFGDPGLRDAFALGGAPSQDLLGTLVNGQPLSGRWLRGFPPGAFVGDARWLANLEYRAPLWYLHRGTGTFPLAARRLWATAFADAGGAWWRGAEPRLGWDVGAELALSLSLLQSLDVTLRAGYARGFGPGGGNAFYLLVTP